MVKTLLKSLLKCQQVNVKLLSGFEHGIKIPAVLRHCGDDAEVKTWNLSPAMILLSLAPWGPGLQRTGTLNIEIPVKN